jgi:two-component system cell cycle sensor histidine kinase/response regulator CckA
MTHRTRSSPPAFAAVPIGSCQTDDAGRLLRVSDELCRMLDLPRDELLSRPLSAWTHPGDRDRCAAAIAELLSGRTETLRFLQRFQANGGRIIPSRVAVAVIPGGEHASFLFTVEELAQPQEDLAQVREREAQLVLAQQIASLGSWEIDLATRHTRWSAEMFRMFGRDPDPAGTGLTIAEVVDQVHPEDRERLAEVFDTAMARGEEIQHEYRIVGPAGDFRTMHVHGRIERDGAGDAVRLVGIAQDVTERKEAEREAQRRARQQAAIALLGQLALAGADIPTLFGEAAELVNVTLEVDIVAILERVTDNTLRLVTGVGYAQDVSDMTIPAGRDESQAGYTIAVGLPVISDDLASETRFAPTTALLQNGVTSGMSVLIPGGERGAFGTLGAHSIRKRTFDNDDVNFLRAIANVLAQTIDRRRAEARLSVHAAQQTAVAEFGRRALSPLENAESLGACDVVMKTLGVEFCSYFEMDESSHTFNARDGATWRGRGDGGVPAALQTQAAYTLLSEHPVIVTDYRTETRFARAHDFVRDGIASGISVAVGIRGRRYGVLTAHTRTERSFTLTDASFLQSIANILAEATERRVGEAALKASAEQYRSVVEGSAEIMFTCTLGGRLTSLNRAFETITGWMRADWIGRELHVMVHPGDHAAIRRAFAAVERGELLTQVPVRAFGRSGQLILFEISFAPRVRDGVTIEIFGFARDVTEKSLAEMARVRTTRELQLLLESADEGIYTTDVAGVTTLVNRSAARMLGYEPEELLGRRAHDVFHHRRAGGGPPPDDECGAMSVLTGGEGIRVRHEFFWTREGKAIPVEYTAAPIRQDGEILGAVVTFSDVTERRNLERQLEQAKRMTSLGRLAATIAHEFNNVLMGVLPFVELIRRESGANERLKTATAHIATSVARGRGITQEILRFTQPAELLLKPIVVGDWWEHLNTEARNMLDSRFTVVFERPDEDFRMLGDPAQLHQVFTNLILNARDAMADGGRLTLGAEVCGHEQAFAFDAPGLSGSCIHFTVSDTGSGIPAEILPHIFDPLFTTKKGGTGLGLAVAHQVVKRHGGEIVAQSTPGEGTSFHVFIPLTPDLGEPDAPPESPILRTMTARRVLLIEDEIAVASGIVALLEMEGMQVDVIHEGREALPAINRTRPDAVVLDVGLPDIDGVQVYQNIAARWPALPVVFSTGHGDQTKLEAYLTLPHVDYLLKPYEIGSLLDSLQRVCLQS